MSEEIQFVPLIIASQLDARNQPCNLVELMPRLLEQ